jgi:hypothetical protein
MVMEANNVNGDYKMVTTKGPYSQRRDGEQGNSTALDGDERERVEIGWRGEIIHGPERKKIDRGWRGMIV